MIILFVSVVALTLFGILVSDEIKLAKLQPKIHMADMVIKAANSAPTNMATVIVVSRH